jgi:hypothetical protein
MIRIWLTVAGLLLSAASANAAAPGELDGECGGDAPCQAGLWCEPPSGTCGGSGWVGVCVDPMRACHHNYHAVCGCDGMTYGNDCAREHALTPQAHAGKC